MSPVRSAIPPEPRGSTSQPAGNLQLDAWQAEARGLPELLRSGGPTRGPSPPRPCALPGRGLGQMGEGAGSCLHPSFPSRKRVPPYSPPAGLFSQENLLKMISCLEHVSLRRQVQALRFHSRVTVSCTSGTAWGSRRLCSRPRCQGGFLLLRDLIYKSLCVAVEGGPPTQGSLCSLDPGPASPASHPPPLAAVPSRLAFALAVVLLENINSRRTRRSTYQLSPAFSGHCPAPHFAHLTLSGCRCEHPSAFLRACAISLDGDWGVFGLCCHHE